MFSNFRTFNLLSVFDATVPNNPPSPSQRSIIQTPITFLFHIPSSKTAYRPVKKKIPRHSPIKPQNSLSLSLSSSRYINHARNQPPNKETMAAQLIRQISFLSPPNSFNIM